MDLELSDEVDSNFEDLDQLRETVKGKRGYSYRSVESSCLIIGIVHERV